MLLWIFTFTFDFSFREVHAFSNKSYFEFFFSVLSFKLLENSLQISSHTWIFLCENSLLTTQVLFCQLIESVVARWGLVLRYFILLWLGFIFTCWFLAKCFWDLSSDAFYFLKTSRQNLWFREILSSTQRIYLSLSILESAYLNILPYSYIGREGSKIKMLH